MKPPVVPEPDWERAERRLFAARDAELAAAPPPDLRRGLRRLVLFTVLVAGVTAGAAFMLWRRAPAASPVAVTPTRVVTPEGGATRLELGDASVDVGPAAELSVARGDDGSVKLVLGRGLVDCEVEPRPGRAAFEVVAGDVKVTVVGTRFTVERHPVTGVRVVVLRGKVRVDSPQAREVVPAGRAWEPGRGVVAAAQSVRSPPVTAQSVPAGPGPSAEPASASPPPEGPPALATDPSLTSAELAARVERELAGQRWDAALAAARDYEQRFPRGDELHDVLWFRVLASCGGYRSRAAEAAARVYLRRFPEGAHAMRAASRAVCVP